MTRHVLRGVATARSDLLLRASQRRFNVVDSLDYIRGSALRGHFAHRWLASGRPADATFERVFQSGEVRFEHAYPLVGDEPGWPAPFSLHACKTDPLADGHASLDLLTSEGLQTCAHPSHAPGAEPWSGGALKRLRGYVSDTGAVLRGGPAMRVQQRLGTYQDGSGRGAEASRDGQPGGLFTERRIAARTPFHVEVRGPSELLEQLGDLLAADDELAVGRARSIHGRLELEDWELTADEPPPRAAGEGFTLTLLSDAVLLDGYLRGRTDLDAPEGVAAALGCGPDEVTVRAATLRTTTVGGWDALNRIPKPVDVAIAAGSAVWFDAPPEAVDALASAPWIGWRGPEGFGCVRVDWPPHRSATFHRHRPPAATPDTSTRAASRRLELASTAREVADQFVAQDPPPTRALWQSIEAAVRAGIEPTAPSDQEPPRGQQAAGRGAGSGEDRRRMREASVSAFLRTCEHLEIRPDSPDAAVLADDIGAELDLRRRRARQGSR